MTKGLLGLAAVVLTATAAAAQYPPGYIPSQGYPGAGGNYPGAYGGYGGGYGGGGYPGGGGTYPQGNFLPNYYNRQNQPLSPYLNLLRGGNTATNYFYGVRPGTTQGGGIGGVGGGPQMYMPLRAGFLPNASNPAQDPVTIDANQTLPFIPSSAHPVYFAGSAGRYTGGSGAGSANRTGLGSSQQPPSAARSRPTTTR